eukprot:Em0007g1322a
MAKKLGDSQPGFSDISGLGTKSLKSLIQSAVEKALEAERARTVSAGLTSSGEYTVEMSPKTFWDDEPRLSRRYLRELRTVVRLPCQVSTVAVSRAPASTVAVSRAPASTVAVRVMSVHAGAIVPFRTKYTVSTRATDRS